MAMGKKFKVTERVGLEFRAEAFNILNHHNFYVNETTLAISGATPSESVFEEKGGLGSSALGGNNDERRFGQFSLRASF
jgi:hypothetical protein